MLIETVTLCTDDLPALQTFYGERLGLPITFEGQSERLTIKAGASELVFQHAAGFAGRYHFAFNIPENRLSAAQAFLRARSITLLPDVQGETLFDLDFWDAHTLYFYDTAGNIAEFIARHELPNGPPCAEDTPFSPAELQNVSEIGLPAADISALAALLTERCGMAPYRETSPTFMPLGDANGLFILVPVGRVWFPDTGIAAEALPVQAVIRNNAGARFAVGDVPHRIAAL